MQALIAADNSLAIFAVLMTVVALACWLEQRPRVGQFAVIGIIVVCMLLNGLSILPHASPVYRIINDYFVPLAIPLMLFNADIKRIWRESGVVLTAFIGATLATVLATLLALNLTAIHSEETVWGGIVAAGFIGSSGNTIAVAAALEKASDPFFGLLLASMYVATVPFVALMLAMPGIPWLWRRFSPLQRPDDTELVKTHDSESAPVNSVGGTSAASLSAALALSALICWCGDYLAQLTDFTPTKFLVISLLSVLLATALPRPMQRLHGHQQLGHILLYMIFAIIGVQVDFSIAFESGSQIMLFAVILLGTHLVLMALFGRLFNIAGPELLIASNACLLGPPTAAAMAASRGWHSLITPGILCGVLGYSIANFIGVAIAHGF